MESDYKEFLHSRVHSGGVGGFEPTWYPEGIYPFQAALVGWAQRLGRGALFADCGLGKTIMQATWGHNVVRHTNKPVLVLTPLAVGYQTVQECEKFGIESSRSLDGKVHGPARIIVANYEKLHLFDKNDFAGVVCDESSILKNVDGATKAAVIEFMRTIPYRLLCTATAAPNDFVELGTSSEALGNLGYMDMIERFFKSADSTNRPMDRHRFNTGKRDPQDKWRFRGHSEGDFWRWVCGWARAVRKPSDVGFDDDGYDLPPLIENQHVVKASNLPEGWLFEVPAMTLIEQRAERRRTIVERCEKAAELANHDKPVVSWCSLNDEGDMLTKLIDGAVQVSGKDTDEAKEEAYIGFAQGQIRAIVTKPRVAGFGLNWQHCAHQTMFPSHSFEQYYQSVRRCWRFGQKQSVTVDIITSEGESRVLENMQRKSRNAQKMFAKLVELMNDGMKIAKIDKFKKEMERPKWL
jgi:hypothetical protein